jgi:hypothetical protein
VVALGLAGRALVGLALAILARSSSTALLPTCPAVTVVRQLVLQFGQHKS